MRMSTPTTEVHHATQPLAAPASGAVTKQLIVQKFGGSSVADADGVKRVAKRVVDAQAAGNEVVVVVSAMGDTTDELLDLAAQVTDSAPAREMDMLLSAGERISMALLAMAINKYGASAQSFTGSQAGMITDGIHTADPRVVPSARKIDSISSEEMLELAASGAKILHLRCVEYARRFGVPLHVRSSFSQNEGTWVLPGADDKITSQEGVALEQPIISGVAHDRSEAKVTVVGVPDIPGKAAAIFQVIADAHSNIDMIVQNVSTHGTGKTDISFTLPIVEGAEALAALKAAQDQIGFEAIEYNEKIGKLSLIGAGMRSHPGVSARFFAALSEAGININMISTSEIRISVVTHADQLDDAVRAIHKAFDLDSEDEATVYGGTGR